MYFENLKILYEISFYYFYFENCNTLCTLFFFFPEWSSLLQGLPSGTMSMVLSGEWFLYSPSTKNRASGGIGSYFHSFLKLPSVQAHEKAQQNVMLAPKVLVFEYGWKSAATTDVVAPEQRLWWQLWPDSSSTFCEFHTDPISFYSLMYSLQ